MIEFVKHIRGDRCYDIRNSRNEASARKESAGREDSHQHHFEERAVFVGCGVRAVGTNECVSTS